VGRATDRRRNPTERRPVIKRDPAFSTFTHIIFLTPTALIWDDSLAAYRFRPGHPLNPRRLELTVELIRRLGLAGDEDRPIVAPRAATEEELLLVHTPEYVDAVRRLSAPGTDRTMAAAFGLGTEDTPVVEGMHEAGLCVVGATLTAAELVMTGRVRRAFAPSGGLHHAMPARASGFCVYNDLAVAIRWIQKRYGARVLYIDYDAHHGDGVQGVFYGDPEVLTVSFHESGRYLFPGTGFVDELGEGDGYGYSVNVPLDAGTEDGSWLAAFTDLVPALADAFRPDVIVLQNGCDGHVLDPLADLRATTGLFEALVGVVSDVADRHCGGRIVATGGGGYAVYAVVPRAWTLVWGALCGDAPPDAIPEDWLEAVRAESGEAVPSTLRDPPGAYAAWQGRAGVEANNARTVQEVRRKVLPLLSGWGLEF